MKEPSTIKEDTSNKELDTDTHTHTHTHAHTTRREKHPLVFGSNIL